ncbi:hypothetical protein [Flavobacterium sp. N3904]|uniref:hypothetical protein n=1 Tax=Flavobacterium sp. N3904 TaxID=2986835 RepID=UPI0022242D66|nr:hypothetical protein [Flavobacterium sp. N3904]
MTNNIEKIYSDFIINFENKSDFVIDFYEKNSIYFNNIKQFKDKKELSLYIEMLCKYAEAIYQKNRYNLTLDIIAKKLLFIDNEIQRLNAAEIMDCRYYSLLFVKGMSSYYLKDYKTATPIFKELVHIDNQNDLYKKWLTYSKYGLNLWLVKMINIVCGGFVLIQMVFDSQINNYFSIVLLVIGLLGLLTNWSYEYYIGRNFRKANEN